MKPAELREAGDAELRQRLADCREELFNLRFQYATRQLTNYARMRELRRDVARILTQLHERERAMGRA
ncbi:MAG: 50S ribosomal protein L29 [Chloroflexi bacterium]|nr:50S ribosomal protein L29 [Chloroflexota bacterium]